MIRAYEKLLTADLVKSVVRYDPLTGRFFWIVRPCRNKFPGEIAGTINSKGYWRITIRKVAVSGHRLAWFYVYGTWPAGDIDHINNIRSDNRIENLRIATPSQNGANRLINNNNSSGIRGVHWNKRKRKWQVRICVNGRRFSLGYHDTLEQAGASYTSAAMHYNGVFAKLAA